MVVPAGGAWLALHVLLLLAATPRLLSMALTAPSMASSWSGHDDDNITAFNSREKQQRQQQQQQANMPSAKGGLYEQADIQVGCRELRAMRYISDGFCTSTKPIKEVVCAGHCLPIRNLPWYAEFVKVWAKEKVKEWQCEEDIVRRKNVTLLCRNGKYRYYRIKVVKSCQCKRTVSKHNRTAVSSSSSPSSGEGKKKKKKRKKDRRRRGRKNKRRGGKKKNRKEEREEEEKVDVSQAQRQESSDARRKERRGNRKRSGQKGEERNSEPDQADGAPRDSSPGADSERHSAAAHPAR